jgi:hypothetical protein
MEFNFDSFASQWGFDSDVLTALKAEKFCTKAALVGMSDEDIRDLPLKRGDMAAVRVAVKQLQGDSGGGPLASPNTGPSVTAATGVQDPGTLLNDLLRPDRPTAGGLVEGLQRMDLDPQVYLHRGGEACEAKALLIPDFLPNAVADVEEISLGPQATLTLKGRRQTKLQSVTPAQWIAANARIMASLVDSRQLDDAGVRDYLSYTAKVGELACRYTWASVLAYDNAYRARQATAGFRWGCDSQHLATVALREKPVPPTTATRQVGKKRGPGGKEVCLQFNKGRCSYGPKCNFEHVCLLCDKPHSQLDHHSPAESSKQD